MNYAYIKQTIYLVHIMGKIMMPPGAGQDGFNTFLNKAMAFYLHYNQDSKDKELDKFKKCFNSGEVSLYLTDLHEPEGPGDPRRYELVAVNSDGGHKCFQVQCDVALQVSAIKKVKTDELSAGSQEFIEDIKADSATHVASPRP